MCFRLLTSKLATSLLLAFMVISTSVATAEESPFEQLRLQILRGNLDKALQNMKTESSQGLLDNIQTNVLQGFFFNGLGKPKEAIGTFRTLIKEESVVPAIVHVGLADALLRIGEFEEARINIRKAFLIEPLSVSARLLDILIDSGERPEEATIKAFIKAQEDTDHAEEVEIAFATFLINNASSQANNLIEEMLERRPGNAYLLEKGGQAQFLAGLSDQALMTFKRATQKYKEASDEFNFSRLESWLVAFAIKTGDKKIEDIVADEKSTPSDEKDVSSKKADVSESERQLAEIKTPPLVERDSTKQAETFADSDKEEEIDSQEAKPSRNRSPILSPQAVPDPIVVSKGSQVSTGSGFITNSGKWVITNRHVVENWTTVQVRNGLGERREAREIRFDKYLDLAVIELAEPYDSALSHKLSDIVEPKVGESVFVIGFPLSQIFGSQYPVISTGIVSSNFGYMESESQFQVTAKMNPGNSGGPVFNKRGQVIGVAVAKLDKKQIEKSSGKMPEDVNFALKGGNITKMVGRAAGEQGMNNSKTLDAEEIYSLKRPSVVVVVNESD